MKWYTHLGDFANMLKAFIGSNYLSVSYAFYQSGIGLGILGLILVASLTDHCCYLIVKTKYAAIKNQIKDLKIQSKPKRQYLAKSDSEDVSENDIDYKNEEIVEQEEYMKRHMSYGDVGWHAFGRTGLYTVNTFIAITQFGFCVAYFIFIGNTIYSIFPSKYCDNGNTHSNASNDLYPLCQNGQLRQSSSATNMSDISNIVQQSTAPSLKLLVASPLPIFIMFSMIRTIRKLSSISLLANLSIFTGCIAVFLYIIIDFKVQPDIQYFNWEGLPVFFGMLTASFEGIGLVIPVESSMEGNRHNFAAFLHGAIIFLTFILGGFGVLGYLRFGSEVNQMLNTNISATSWVSYAVNICVAVGVILTFPLQMYPVTEMIEIVLFSHGSICGPKKKDKDDQADTLLTKESHDLVKLIPKEVAAWKRNIIRLVVVCIACGLAVIFRNSFAYIGAFTGAVGSSLLAYILPCLFHLKICGKNESRLIIVKDVTIIIVGVIGSIVSLYSVIRKLIDQTSV